MWQEGLLEETVGDAAWEGDIPVCCSGATIGVTLCPQTLSLSHALLLGSAGEEVQQDMSLAASSHLGEFGFKQGGQSCALGTSPFGLSPRSCPE